MTEILAQLEVSKQTYDEIEAKMKAAGVTITKGGMGMNGIVLYRKSPQKITVKETRVFQKEVGHDKKKD